MEKGGVFEYLFVRSYVAALKTAGQHEEKFSRFEVKTA
jgi:hypothetical protein